MTPKPPDSNEAAVRLMRGAATDDADACAQAHASAAQALCGMLLHVLDRLPDIDMDASAQAQAARTLDGMPLKAERKARHAARAPVDMPPPHRCARLWMRVSFRPTRPASIAANRTAAGVSGIGTCRAGAALPAPMRKDASAGETIRRHAGGAGWTPP